MSAVHTLPVGAINWIISAAYHLRTRCWQSLAMAVPMSTGGGLGCVKAWAAIKLISDSFMKYLITG